MPMPELHTAPALSRLCGIFSVSFSIMVTVNKMATLVGMIMYNPVKGKYVNIDKDDSDDTGIFLMDGKTDFIRNLKKT